MGSDCCSFLSGSCAGARLWFARMSAHCDMDAELEDAHVVSEDCWEGLDGGLLLDSGTI